MTKVIGYTHYCTKGNTEKSISVVETQPPPKFIIICAIIFKHQKCLQNLLIKMRWRNLSCILKTEKYDINLGNLKKKVTLSQQLDDICIIIDAQIVVS